MVDNFKLIDSGLSVSESDIDALEVLVGFRFPEEFRQLYLSSNGGSPSREFWAEDDNYEPIRVEDFKFIARAGAPDKSETKYIGGCFDFMVRKKVLPPQLVPFAVDEAGNFICFEKWTGKVVYFAVDVFQPDVDMHINHINAQKILSLSFSVFVSSLVDEDDVDF